MKKGILALFLLMCVNVWAGPNYDGIIWAGITLSPTLSFTFTTNQISESTRKKEEVKAAQADAILYMQNLSEGQPGTLTPLLQRGIEIVAEIPEARGRSEAEIVVAIAVTDLNSVHAQ